MHRATVSALALVVCLGGAAAAVAAEPTESGNVRITIEIGESQAGRRAAPSTYQLVMQLGETATFNAGDRVPIPAHANAPADEDGEKLLASYSYQNVGLSGRLFARRLSENRILIQSEVQASLLRGSASPPVIGTFNQNWAVALEDGQPIRVAEVAGPETGGYYVEVRADLLR